MKNLMRVISALLAFVVVIVIIEVIIEDTGDFGKFASKVLSITSDNLGPIIAIAACAYCLERNDQNYLVRIIPIYMSIPILLSIIKALFDIDEGVVIDICNFIDKTISPVLALSLIAVIKPNNKITTIMSYIAYGLIALLVILTVLVNAKSYLLSNLPDAYGSSRNYSRYSTSVSDDNEFVLKLYTITQFTEIFIIILLYTTNYGFSDKIELETEDIDYEAVKRDAENAANAQMQKIYHPENTNTVASTSGDQRMMNISNQLGQNSNVGTASGQAKEVKVTSSIDSVLALSKNPIVNESISGNETQTQVVQQAQPAQVQEAPAPTTPPNLDIQQQMQMKLQSNQVQAAPVQQPATTNQVPQQVQQMQNQLQQQIQQQTEQAVQQQNINQ